MIIPTADRLSEVSEYYFSKKLKEIKSLQNQGKDIINLGIGSPDLPPSNHVVEALCETAKGASNHGYQSYIGIPELRKAITDWLYQNYNTPFETNEVLPLIGSKEGIMHIAMAFINPGDKVLVPNPGYPTYRSVNNIVQAELVEYKLDEKNDWLIDFGALSSLPLDDIKVMWLNYPNMPTGVAGTLDQFSRLVALARKHKFLIVNDNPYGVLFENEAKSIFQIEGAREVCLELNSLSKSHNMAGWRVGWVTANENYISAILKVKSNMDSGMFLGIQRAAIEALHSDAIWYSDLQQMYAKRRLIGYNILSALQCDFSKKQGGMFVWGKVPQHVNNAAELVDELLSKVEVFCAPGFIFGSVGEQHIRISLCSPIEVLEKALVRIRDYKKTN